MDSQTLLDKLFSKRRIEYNGVTIEVSPAPFHEVPTILESLDYLWSEFLAAYTDNRLSQWAVASVDKIAPFVDKFISIPGLEGISIRDMPLPVVPLILEAFIDTTLSSASMGNWHSLGEKVVSLLPIGRANDEPQGDEENKA